ncbi:PGPGW domain-containing protein [Hugonella massiliensis]|uniref:PGPGW domain-containing protein n=1 Tax=Hugonella massiliensis TaxID=1720315 RepID=UPI0009EAB974|nr:PGPGW domain-containing protein [Hugonella massiliensis]
MRRIGLILLGMVLVLVGIPMLVLPGPGLLAIGGGAACIARAFRPRRSQSA